MSVRYSTLPNPRSDSNTGEMEAAFDYSEDEDEGHDASESQPLNPTTTPPHVPPPQQPSRTYDFENIDYDYPPPGSPPGPSQVALPNNHGNSNGFVPSVSFDSAPGPQRNWFSRTAVGVLPSSFAQRFGLTRQRPAGVVGGGTLNDGVFANVTAKPQRPVTIQDGKAVSPFNALC
jgi:hypothetical protein